ncbi:MAG TPA: hypothetical protein VFZ36_05265, partial [Vicinamibacterales bacterium]
YSCANGIGRAADWSYANEKGATDKASLGAKLKTATEACTAAFATGTNLEALVEGLAHVNLHYGNIVTYMRMLGLVPPSS